MFHRMFGRRKSPVPGDDTPTDSGVEASEEKPDDVNTDGFVILDNTSTGSAVFDPPPGYTVGGATAFLPYGLDSRKSSANGPQRMHSADIQTAIDGIPFKLGSNVLLEGSTNVSDSPHTNLKSRIEAFNWDEYEYSFELERSVLRALATTEQKES